ncbi:hypothetical protein [Campylobacter devanensis]|uniref:hypothetical protein n=1 Tax=Campylobacter devanensis TaxID=3161138 RepID=UPI000A32C45A|nr:hypothetical protein [Campylobacter sp. P160]
MNAKVITNTKLALILYRFNLDKFKPIWKQKAKVVCKHTQRMRIMWERICENEATLPLFDEDYKFDHPLELFKPELPQSIEIEQPKEQTKNRHNRGTPLAGTLVFGSLGATCCPAKRTSKNKSPSLEELKELFWAEELQERSYRRKQ